MGAPSLPREGCLIELQTRFVSSRDSDSARVRESQNSNGANSLPPHDLSPGTARSWKVHVPLTRLLGGRTSAHQAHNLNVSFIRELCARQRSDGDTAGAHRQAVRLLLPAWTRLRL